jgi:hypothetical protein
MRLNFEPFFLLLSAKLFEGFLKLYFIGQPLFLIQGGLIHINDNIKRCL